MFPATQLIVPYNNVVILYYIIGVSMTKSQTIQVRVTPETKCEADKILSALGLSMSEAVNLFLHQLVLQRGLPFAVAIPWEDEAESLPRKISDICMSYGIERLTLFGSRARGTASESSDYDFLLHKGNLRGVDYFSFKFELEERLGSKIDLITSDAIKDDFADAIAGDEVIVYDVNGTRQHRVA